MDTSTNVEALLEHADWVRALARTLVADSSSAEDVEQEAWLAALRHPPRDASNPRGWLGTVVRNAARKLARERVRRSAREADVARDEALPSAAELVEQANLQRELAGFVVELDEPYRSTLLLRFFQGLEVSEIAARTGVPVATVRTRVQRGLASLREKLDRRHGDRATWLAALAPLTRTPAASGSVAAGVGAWLVLAKAKWGLAAALMVAVGVWWYRGQPGELAVPTSASSAALRTTSADTTDAGARVAVASEPSLRAPVVVPANAPPAPDLGSFEGRCVDVAGRALAGIELEFVDEREVVVDGEGTVWTGNQGFSVSEEERRMFRAFPATLQKRVAQHPGFLGLREALLGEPFERTRMTSGADGAFRMEHTAARGKLVPRGDAWLLVAQASDVDDPLELFVLAPAVSLGGVVVDAHGIPLTGATVDLSTNHHVPELPNRHVRDSRTVGYWTTKTDDDGRFVFERAPGVAGQWVKVQCSNGDGSLWHGHVEAAGSSQLALRIETTLQAAQTVATIRGTVVDESGAPVAHADVRFGQDGAATDELGAYSFRVSSTPHEATQLTALVRGRRPAAIPSLANELVRGAETLAPPLVIRESLSPIRGRVLDADGAPANGWRVDLADGTPYGSSTSTLEGLACGRNAAGVAVAPDGSFELGGLLEREYRVRAWNPATMAELVSALLRAGERVELRAAADLVRPRIAGRVLSTLGEPLQGVSVRCGLVIAKSAWLSQSIHRNAETDADGRFELRNVGREAQLSLCGEGIAAGDVVLEPNADPENLTLVARRELRFRLELFDSDAADRYAVENAAGERMNMIYKTPGLTSGGRVLERVHGSFPLTIVPEEATTLVLLQGETVLRKVPLQLRWRELTVVTP
ncbi:MAG: sigma-70 family RNA polymerase sigma factor [Planctomycetes bacterium]|nr:sigma-70 family RNA polymerase sigma factor [Planctomycetota bacterium]